MHDVKSKAGIANSDPPLTRLPREDLELITELVLQSGSLKGLARAYGVSYPTIRGRLDKVIERLRGLVEGRAPDPVNDLLASLVERGELSTVGARRLRELIRERDQTGDQTRDQTGGEICPAAGPAVSKRTGGVV